MRCRSIILRVLAVAVLLYSLTHFFSGLWELRETERRIALLQEELDELRNENIHLKDQLSPGQQSSEMEKLARERLGMVMPGEKIFIFQTDREEPTWGRK